MLGHGGLFVFVLRAELSEILEGLNKVLTESGPECLVEQRERGCRQRSFVGKVSGIDGDF